MLRKILKYIMTSSFFISISLFGSEVWAVCTGKFIDPISTLCWLCIYPISIGSTSVGDGPDPANPANPVCYCVKYPIYQVGVTTGFWEPFRIADVTKFPGCMVGLGTQMSVPTKALQQSTSEGDDIDDANKHASWHFHWYSYPVWEIIGILDDIVSLSDSSGFDVLDMSEMDVQYMDDALANVMTPESVTFGNKIAQASCAADAISAVAYLPIDALFWCAGAQGPMYPLSGHITTHLNDVQSTYLAVEKWTYHLFRDEILESVQTETWGPLLCIAHPEPIMRKSAFRGQLAFPVPELTGPHPFGQTTQFWEYFKSIPISGENYAWVVWRKHNMCAF